MQYIDDPWSVEPAHFPRAGSRRDQMKFLLNYAVLAPSVYNTQPWRFRTAGDTVELYADRSRMLAVSDPHGRQLIISCGAALLHLRMSMAYFGFEPVVKTFPQVDIPDLLASIKIGPERESTPQERRLFESIKRRRTQREEFGGNSVPADLLRALEDAASEEGVLLDYIEKGDRRHAFSELVEEGERIQGKDGHYRQELARWFRATIGDGKSADGTNAGVNAAEHGRYATAENQTVDPGSDGAPTLANKEFVSDAPVLGVVSTRADNPFEWLAAGQALARLLLLASAGGLQACFLNQPVEVTSLRSRLAAMVGSGRMPQIVFRMGYGNSDVPVPRRPLHDVVASF